MFKLYWEYMAGSIVAQAMLEEMGAEYQLFHVDMEAGEHRQEEYLMLNPLGRVPALGLPDGKTIGETAAIVVCLGEYFPQSMLVPQPGEKDRARFLFLLNVMATSGYLTIARWNHPERYALEPDAIRQVEAKSATELDAFFKTMDRQISSQPYMLEQGFSALDIYLTMLTEWPDDRKALFQACPSIKRMVEAVNERPAYQKAMQTHHLPEMAA